MTPGRIVAALAASTCIVALAVPAHAQERSYHIPAGSLKAALDAFGRQSGRPVIFKADEVRGTRTAGFRGSASAENALRAILSGTGFTMRGGESGSIAVVRVGSGQSTAEQGDNASLASNGVGATPEIIVTGERSWSLNTGIRRTQDDAQPWVVFDEKQIKRSGSRDLDSFFRDFLAANVNPSVSGQSETSIGQTNINLRGLGSDETLILVDGRRMPGVNRGTGRLSQPSITGIPMGSIARIEVLPSSASAIYGGGATGGVINIILKRDYRGLEASASYANVFDGSAADRRIDLSGGLALEQGRTNVTFSATIRKLDPLVVGDNDLVRNGRAYLQAVNPGYFTSAATPPLGATPNIRSTTGAVLTLKPAYGGASLGSAYTHIPDGFRGVALDGIAPLVAAAGSYNLDLAPTAQQSSDGSGAKYPLLAGGRTYSGSLAIRREFTSWLRVYAELAASRDEAMLTRSVASNTVTLGASAPNNPFQQAIRVTAPFLGTDAQTRSRNDTITALGGAIVKLPFQWQAIFDYSWSRNTSRISSPSAFAATTTAALTAGTLDVLRDQRTSPLNFTFLDGPNTEVTPSQSVTRTTSFRLAGPLPVRLPGGRATVTVLAERSVTDIGSSINITRQSNIGLVFYSPDRQQDAKSVYGEVRLPLLSEKNGIPFIRKFELQIAARYDNTRGRGALGSTICLQTTDLTLIPRSLGNICPPANTVIQRATIDRTTFDPTFSFLWQPLRDITFRGSYATAYLPPNLNQLIKTPSINLAVNVTDPLRGNERIGTPGSGSFYSISGFTGGNPDVRPETSKSYSFGVIFNPHFIRGLRLSADWTKIVKSDNYFSPTSILASGTTADGQRIFEDFLRRAPERFTRGPASDGFPVGRITSVDISLVNLAGSRVETLDFTADYHHKLFSGNLDVAARGTWLRDLTIQTSQSAPKVQYAGVLSQVFQMNGVEGGAVWKWNGSAMWSNDSWSIGWRGRYVGRYFLSTTHVMVATQGSATVPGQMYNDVFGSYRIDKSTEVMAGVNNVLNHKPPFDVFSTNFFSGYGDPRLSNFYITLNRKF